MQVAKVPDKRIELQKIRETQTQNEILHHFQQFLK